MKQGCVLHNVISRLHEIIPEPVGFATTEAPESKVLLTPLNST